PIVLTISRPWGLIENSETVMRRILSAAALAAVLCTSAIASDKGSTPPASTAAVPAGAYTLDKAHASLIFKVNHLGFSNYTARFKRFDAKLQFDPADLPAAKLIATVDVTSLETDFPDPAMLDSTRSFSAKNGSMPHGSQRDRKS